MSHRSADFDTAAPRPGWRNMLMLAILTNPAAIIGSLMPTFVDALVARGYKVGAAATLGSIELFAMAIIVVLAPLIVNRWDRRTVALCGLILAVIGQFGTLWVAHPIAIGTLRMAAGAGEGALYAVAIASISAMPAPDRAFGAAVATNLVATTILLALIAWYHLHAPGTAAMLIMGIFLLAHAPFIPALPKWRSPATAASGSMAPSGSNGISPMVVMSGLLGMFLLFFGFGLVWPVASQIATQHGLDSETIAAGFGVAGLGGIIGAVVATLLGVRHGRLLPLTAGTLAMAFALWLVGTDFFVGAALLVMLCMAFNLPYYLGLMASIDPTGRIAVLTSGMVPFGVAAGQIASGTVKEIGGFAALPLCGSAVMIMALAASGWAEMAGRKIG